jgi:uncharacterized BrkB/YihY/UPF0761 family membrane protein
VWITPGSLVATGLWLVVSFGFRLYVQNFANYTAVYGAIGAVIVLMLWLYLSGFALLLGAELNAEIDKALPSRDTAPRVRITRRRSDPRRSVRERRYPSRSRNAVRSLPCKNTMLAAALP